MQFSPTFLAGQATICILCSANGDTEPEKISGTSVPYLDQHRKVQSEQRLCARHN